MKKILSFDLDNTLFDNNSFTIPRSALNAINSMRNKFFIVIATGRDLSMKTNKWFVEQLLPDACVHSNGAQVTINGAVVYRHLFSKKLLMDLVSYCNNCDICLCGIVNDFQYTNRIDKMQPLANLLSGGRKVMPYKRIELLMGENVMTLGTAATETEVEQLLDCFPDICAPAVIPNVWYDVMEKSVSKISGMHILLEHLGASMSDVVAVGDSMNDFELVSEAGLGVAMGNADIRLKNAADFVTKDIDDDGIKHALEYISCIYG